MLEADEPVVVQNSTGVSAPPRGRGGTSSSRSGGGAVRLVDEEPDFDRLQSPRDTNQHERPIGTPDRPTFDHVNLNNNAQQNTPNASITMRTRVGDDDATPPQRNRGASNSPPPAANGNSPPPTNRAAEALQRELNRQRGGRGGAAGRGRGGAQPRNRLARRGNNNDDSDRSSGDDDNAGNANPANGGAAGSATRNGGNTSTVRPKKNRLTNGEILTRPHVVLQSHTLPDDTIAAIDPSANQPKNYYGGAYGDKGLNVGKPAMKQAITLDSDWKFPLFPGGCSVLACCQTRCEIVRLWGKYANAEVEGSEKGAQGLCCKILGGHNVDGQNYRHPRVLVPLQNPTSNTSSNPNYVGGNNGEFTMSHGDEEMQPSGNDNNNNNRNGGSSSSSSPSDTSSSSRRMLITMIVLDVLSLGIPCGPFYNGMGTAIFGCWSRWQIRRKYRIEGYGWQDGIVMCCFPGCALHQHRNEIEFNQILMSSFGGAREMM